MQRRLNLRARTAALQSDDRAGEILNSLPERRGANQNIGDADHPKVLTRKKARDAGMSKRQADNAVRNSVVSAMSLAAATLRPAKSARVFSPD